MKKLMFLFAFITMIIFTNAQTSPSATSAPTFSGGTEAWQKYLSDSLKENVPVDNGAPQGTYTVIVSFLINCDSISQIHIISAPNPDYGMSAEAIRVIKNSPKWNPAVRDGKPVPFRKRQEIIFTVKNN